MARPVPAQKSFKRAPLDSATTAGERSLLASGTPAATKLRTTLGYMT